MIWLFKLLKEKTANQTAAERLTKMMEEAEELKEQVEEKLLQLFGTPIVISQPKHLPRPEYYCRIQAS